MPESFRTRSYAERPSSQLGVMDYVKNSVIYVLMPVVGVAVGLGLRKTTKLNILQQPYEGIKGIFHDGVTRQGLVNAANAAKNYIPRQAEAWGFGIGAFFGAYKLWTNTAKMQMDVNQVTESVQKLRGMESANQFLARENEQLRQQLSFSERHAPAGAGHADRLDAAASNEHSR